jgi:hypothetical protein
MFRHFFSFGNIRQETVICIFPEVIVPDAAHCRFTKSGVLVPPRNYSLIIALIALFVLSACHAPLKLGTIPTPPKTAPPRIYVQSITDGTVVFRTSHEEFALDNLKKAGKYLQSLGYAIISRDEVNSVLGGGDPPGFYQLKADNWSNARLLGKSLHADYLLFFVRNNEYNETILSVFLVNTVTGKVYQSGYRLTSNVDRAASLAEYGRRKVKVLDELFSKEAQEEMFLTARTAGVKPTAERAAAYEALQKPTSTQPVALATAERERAAAVDKEPAAVNEEMTRLSAERASLAAVREKARLEIEALQQMTQQAEKERKILEESLKTSKNDANLADVKEELSRLAAERANLAAVREKSRQETATLKQMAQQAEAERKELEDSLHKSRTETNPPVIREVKFFDEEGKEIGDVSQSSRVVINGFATDDSGVSLILVNGVKAGIDEKGAFSATAMLKLGTNQITLELYDIYRNKSEQTYTVKRERAALPSAGPEVSAVPDFSALPRPNDFAIIVGIEEYRNIPRAEFAAGDAALVREYVKASGIPERNIAYLANGQATLSDIRKTIETWLPNRTTAKSRVLVYFSGHGAPDMAQGDAYLVPYDGDPGYLADTAYPMNRLFDKLGSLKAKEVIVLLDSCFSGAGGRSVLTKGGRPLVMTVKKPRIPLNVAMMTASRDTQISITANDKRHGLFTYHVLNALKQGKQTLPEIYAFIKPRIEDEARLQNVQQTPTLYPEASAGQKDFSLL